MKMRMFSLLAAACGVGAGVLAACDDSGTSPHPGFDGGVPDGGGPRPDAGNANDAGADADAPRKCTPSLQASGAAFGDWDTRFTLAGLTGRDGGAPTVHDIVRDTDGSLLVAGYFRWAGNLRVDGLARWRNGAWEPGRTNWNGHNPGQGGFTAVAVGPSGELALAATLGGIDDPDEIWVDRGKGLEVVGRYLGPVRRLVWIDGKLWAGGGLELEKGGPKGLAIWDGTTWSGAKGGGPNDYVFDIVPDAKGHVLVAGQFHEIGGVPAELVADWDGTAWSPAYGIPDQPTGRALTLARDGHGTLYVGGLFTLGEENRGSASLAKWNGTKWELAGNGVAYTWATGVVSHILPHDGALYVTGCFDHVNGGEDSPNRIASDGVAKWDGTRWTSLDDGSKPVSNGWLESSCGFEPSPRAVWSMPRQRLAVSGSNVLVGGNFAGAGGVPSQSIAVLDGRAWKAAGKGEQGISGKMLAVASSPESCTVYGLAAASHAGSVVLSSRFVRYEDGAWKPAGPPLPEAAYCDRIAVGKGGGRDAIALVCENRTGMERPGLVLVLKDGAWSPLVTEELPKINDIGYAPDGTLWVAGGEGSKAYLAHGADGKLVPQAGSDAFDGAIYRIAFAPHKNDSGYDTLVGGFFTRIGGFPADRIARWNGSAWSALGEGAGGTVSAIAATKDAVYIATHPENQRNRKVLARWDGTAWTELATPANGIAAPHGKSVHTFLSLLALDGGRLIAAGEVWPETGGRNAFYFDGSKFSPISGGVSAIAVESMALGADAIYFAGNIAEVGDGDTLRPSVGVARLPFAAKAP
ncbi:hypothetical protein [Pendulispora albinea]|uniref:Uncharacterized protein n=1 Tax=Pendulispora albinea TaxID=2741071 RepID=A0ABZ2LSW1_9BACT